MQREDTTSNNEEQEDQSEPNKACVIANNHEAVMSYESEKIDEISCLAEWETLLK